MSKTRSNYKTTFIITFGLILFNIALYAVDLFEFNIDDWDIEGHIPQIILLHPFLNSSSIDLQSVLSNIYLNQTVIVNKSLRVESIKPLENNLSELFANSLHFIDGNPLQNPQCKNAILQKENIQIEDFIKQHNNK